MLGSPFFPTTRFLSKDFNFEALSHTWPLHVRFHKLAYFLLAENERITCALVNLDVKAPSLKPGNLRHEPQTLILSLSLANHC